MACLPNAIELPDFDTHCPGAKFQKDLEAFPLIIANEVLEGRFLVRCYKNGWEQFHVYYDEFRANPFAMAAEVARLLGNDLTEFLGVAIGQHPNQTGQVFTELVRISSKTIGLPAQ